MRQQGATLIQLMSGLVLMGLLTAIGIPSYTLMSVELLQRTAAHDLAQALRIARSHAVLQNRVVVVEALREEWGSGWRILLEQEQRSLREKRHMRPLVIVGNQPVARQVRFNGLGLPFPARGGIQNGTLHVCGHEGDSRYRVVVAPSGRVSLREGAQVHASCAGLASAPSVRSASVPAAPWASRT